MDRSRLINTGVGGICEIGHLAKTQFTNSSNRDFLMNTNCWFVILVFCSALSLSNAAHAGGDVVSLEGKRVLWVGDSITHQGAYVSFAEYFLEMALPESTFDIIEVGRPSETLSGLSEKTHPGPRPCVFSRLQRCLEVIKPQIVVACYGMNDGIYHPQSSERLQAFKDGVNRLIRDCHAAGAQVILLSPPPFDALPLVTLSKADAPDFSYRTPFEGYDAVLTDYATWEQTIPQNDAWTIDVHTPLLDYLRKQRLIDPKFSFVADGIHPNLSGNLLMAETIIKQLGLQTAQIGGDLDHTLADIQADPLFCLIAKQHEIRSEAWLKDVATTTDSPELTAGVAKSEADCAAIQSEIDQLRTARVSAQR